MDVCNQSTVEDIGGHLCLECTITEEKNHRMQLPVVDAKVIRKGFCMSEILAKWILETIFVTKDHLTPLCAILGTEYPPPVIFGLDHEDTKNGNQNVVDLRSAIRRGHDEIVQPVINLGIQSQPHSKSGDFFAKPAFQ